MATGKTRIVGASPADKQNIALARAANKAEAEGKDVSSVDKAVGETTPKKAAAKRSGGKTQVTQRGDQAPEAKKSASAKSAATEKLFKTADEAVLRGLPVDMTREQMDNHTRRAALGY